MVALLAFPISDWRRFVAVYGPIEVDPSHENERAAVLRGPCNALAARCHGSVLVTFFDWPVAYSAAWPIVRIVVPFGIVIGSSKRRDQFTILSSAD
ncbi:hypothetical protein NB311A_00215 [Nitrobacter sp. Nb-311A]|uniref:hypothetical protein n=1 Tax=Nitrobacter sp. Nb-311A TaxID=314253 RepID=UPI0000684D30|nr:hypothetical protein [Nitrobacter sp. Nb-311A]EAQ33708.1 hypothetical protein NB311A_00215 [Nitrobacter sp. Nb-311A]